MPQSGRIWKGSARRTGKPGPPVGALAPLAQRWRFAANAVSLFFLRAKARDFFDFFLFLVFFGLGLVFSMHALRCMYAYVCVCIHVCVGVCMYVCIHVCVGGCRSAEIN